MQKGQTPILILVGILIIAAIGGVFYLGRQTILNTQPASTPTTGTGIPQTEMKQSSVKTIQYAQIPGWQKYDNISGGYSIQYDPNNYKIEDKDETNLKFAITDSLKLVCIPQPPLKACMSGFQINNYSDYHGESRRQWLTASSAHASETPAYYEEVKVANTKILIGIAENYAYIMIPRGNQMILISTNILFNTQVQKTTTLEFIYRFLSTFKFLQ